MARNKAQTQNATPTQVADPLPSQNEAPALIKMVSEHGLEADVHQDMIEEYKAGGYRLAEEV